MNKPLALFAYDFPHRKTQDFIFELLSAGVRDLVVLAAPKKELKHRDETRYMPSTLAVAASRPTKEICENLSLPYFPVAHEDIAAIEQLKRQFGFDSAIISGARILTRDVIDLFEGGVVNFHPGKIPETSGLDSFFYSIAKSIPLGVTTHYIDGKVDAGRQISFDALPIGPSDELEIVSENLYQLQRVALRRYLSACLSGSVKATPVDRPKKNEPMSPDQKRHALSLFPTWRAEQFAGQQRSRLFQACQSGNVGISCDVLDRFPSYLEVRNEMGWSPIIVAAFNQHQELVKILLERGADPNSIGKNGTTVLMYAKTNLIKTDGADYSILDCLLSHGADPHRTDRYGKTVFDYVNESGDLRMIEFFNRTKN